MNAHKHMEAIFAGVLVIGCIVALVPPRQSVARGAQAGPMPVVVITAKRMTPLEKQLVLEGETQRKTAVR